MTRRRGLAIALGATFVAASLGVYVFATEADGYARFRPVLASDLKNHPEATLYFPGSTVIQIEAVDMERFPWAFYEQPAGISTTLGVDATKDDLLAWYEQRLTALGYHDYGNPGTGAWLRGHREFFDVHFTSPSDYGYRPIAQRTEYWVDYWIGLG